MSSRALWLAVLLPALGCSEDAPRTDDPSGPPGIPSGACAVHVTFTGGIDHALFGGEEAACGASFGGDSGVHTTFIPVDGGIVEAFTVDIRDVVEGEVGTFPGTAAVRHEDGREWHAASCVYEVVEHDFENVDEDGISNYTVGARGSCDPAVLEDQADVVIGDFAFRTGSYWF